MGVIGRPYGQDPTIDQNPEEEQPGGERLPRQIEVDTVEADKGMAVFKAAIPAAQPTATITTTGITDAVAKAALHNLILLLNATGGFQNITEA